MITVHSIEYADKTDKEKVMAETGSAFKTFAFIASAFILAGIAWFCFDKVGGTGAVILVLFPLAVGIAGILTLLLGPWSPRELTIRYAGLFLAALIPMIGIYAATHSPNMPWGNWFILGFQVISLWGAWCLLWVSRETDKAIAAGIEHRSRQLDHWLF